jgi:hypothetical protein
VLDLVLTAVTGQVFSRTRWTACLEHLSCLAMAATLSPRPWSLRTS